MSGLEALRVAWAAIRKNMLRSLLAALGIVIAVAAVVATITAGEGARHKVQAEMSALGTNLVYVFPGSSKTRGASGGTGTGRPLTLADGRAIGRELMPWVAAIAPSVRMGMQVVAGPQNWTTSATGTTAAYAQIRPGNLAEGRFLLDADDQEARKVCVLGATVAQKLFAGRKAVGAQVRLGQVPFVVVGVLAAKGQAGFGQDQDDVVFLPFATMTRRLVNLANGGLLTWLVSGKTATLTASMQGQIETLLRQRHHLRPDQPNDFSLFNLQQMQETAQAQMRTLSLVMGAVAIISLVVGAIGIANVMLVSVTERTREIGLRLAVGARRRDIRRQFLVEAVLLSVLGGALGAVLGCGLSVALAKFGGWPVVWDWQTPLWVVCGTGTTGVVAGFYPAFRASRLDPIEALRFE